MLHVVNRATAKTGQTRRGNLQPRHGGIRSGQRFHPLHLRRARPQAQTGIHRRQQGLGRRQPVHFSRHQKNPRHRLENHADHRAGHRPHAPMAPAKPVGAPTPMNLVLTGSSSGIGKFLADSLAAQGPRGLPRSRARRRMVSPFPATFPIGPRCKAAPEKIPSELEPG